MGEIEKGKDMGIDIFKTGNGDFYKLTEDGVKQILGTPVSEIEQDAINPQHYKNCSIECIDAMMMAFGTDWVYKHCILTAWKYMWRYQNKNGLEDIKKARWYIEKAKEIGFDEPELYNMEYVLEKIEKELN